MERNEVSGTEKTMQFQAAVNDADLASIIQISILCNRDKRSSYLFVDGKAQPLNSFCSVF